MGHIINPGSRQSCPDKKWAILGLGTPKTKRYLCTLGFPSGTSGKEPSCQCRRHRRRGFNPWFKEIPWRRTQQPTLVWRVLVWRIPWTEEPGRLQCMGLRRAGHNWSGWAHRWHYWWRINAGDTRDVCWIPGLWRSPGAGSSNPFQYSCLENSLDGGARWATVHGATKSWTQLSTWVLTISSCCTLHCRNYL